jgi:D-sedoheptulose 7-phosphate isomerase
MENRLHLTPEPHMPMATPSAYFAELEQVTRKLPYVAMEQAIEALIGTSLAGGTVFLFGNGGSASLASHFACDLGKGTSDVAFQPFRAVALTDNIPMMTAWANDFGYEHIFAEQLKTLGRPSDLAFAISGSGNSPNVLNALRVARERGMFTVGLTGFQGGKMRGLCDVCVVIPSDNMQIIEDLHLSIAHASFRVIRARMSGVKTKVVAARNWAESAGAADD